MILRITVGDNDFTEELEQFASDIELYEYTRKIEPDDMNIDTLYEHLKGNERFRELFYNIDRYTPELADELCSLVRHRWELWVNNCMKNHDYWDEKEAARVKRYLIRDFKVKFQKSFTPKWENGEVVYICCGYYNRWWTF